MPFKITFYVSEDELSEKLVDILEGLVREVRSRSKISVRDFIPGKTLTTVKITIPTALGTSEELECEVWATQKKYEDDMRRMFALKSLPALRIGREVFTGPHVLEIASSLREMLAGKAKAPAEQVFHYLATISIGSAERVLKEAIDAEAISDLLRATMREKMGKLENMLREGKISRETYEKMKRIYEEIFGRGVE